MILNLHQNKNPQEIRPPDWLLSPFLSTIRSSSLRHKAQGTDQQVQPPRSPSRKKAPNQLTSFLSFPLQTHHQAKQQQPTTNPIFIATVSTTDCRVIQLLFSLHLWPLKLPLTPLKTGPQLPTTSFGKSINTNFFLASSLSLHPINIHHSGRQPSRRKSRGIATNTSCSGLASARHVCRRRDWKLQSLQMFLTPPGPTLALTNELEPTCIRTASCLASSSHSFLFHLQQHNTRTFASSKRQTHRRSALSRPSQSSNSRVIGFRPPGSVGSISHQGSSDFTAESRVSIPSRAIRTRQTSPMEHCRRRKRTHVKKTIIINSTPQPLPPPVPTRITQRSCSSWMIVGPSVSTDKRRTPAAWALLQLSNTCPDPSALLFCCMPLFLEQPLAPAARDCVFPVHALARSSVVTNTPAHITHMQLRIGALADSRTAHPSTC